MTCKNCIKIKKTYAFIENKFLPFHSVFYGQILETESCCCQQKLKNKCEHCINFIERKKDNINCINCNII